MKKIKLESVMTVIIMAIYMTFSCGTILEYCNYINARIDAKVEIAKLLNVDYKSRRQLDNKMLMYARYYSSSEYEDIRITYNDDNNKETIYYELASSVQKYNENSEKYIIYKKILTTIDDYIIYEEKHDNCVVAIGKFNLDMLFFVGVILFFGLIILIGLYSLACCINKKILKISKFLSMLIRGIKSELKFFL